MSQWYFAQSGHQHGPVSELELKSKIMAGEVKPHDLVWCEGMASWSELSKVPELSSALAVTGQAAAPTPAVVSGNPYRSPQAMGTGPYPAGQTVPTYLWQSIAVTLLCCLPLGVVAIIYAAKVEPALRVGDHMGAKAASDSAKLWCWLSFGIGLAVTLGYFGLVFVGVAAGVQP